MHRLRLEASSLRQMTAVLEQPQQRQQKARSRRNVKK